MSLVGDIRVPSDKSISHRALLLASLARGTSHLENLLPSDDVLCTLAAVRALGATCELEEGPLGLSGTVTGWGPALNRGPLDLDCGNSGTTTRLLLGLLAGQGVDATLHGDASLSQRPMGRVLDPLRSMGARFECEHGRLPVHVLGHEGALSGINYTTKQASAQVKSAIMLAALGASGRTNVTEQAASRDHTERLLPAFGVQVQVRGHTVSVDGGQRLVPYDLSAPGDTSSAAFVAVAAALCPGSQVRIRQVALNPTRTGALELLRSMGCSLAYEGRHMEGAEPVGDVVVRHGAQLRAMEVPSSRVPSLIDEVPVLALAAAAANGETVFHGVGELRVKESDRLQATVEALCAMGVEARAAGDDLHIMGCGADGVPASGSVALATHHDHRLAMSWHLAGLAFGFTPVLDDDACVSVSWPGFYDDIAALVR